ncbi:hypothetical protein [Gordonia soli]|uniref:Uncharacterized protein n=1 Tax=Gordonia soli NBRC 108243 TaxID=1223545 RepID=M0QP52_9ACTN|nr:hypothetical protein [Gordonia soli]GAC69222.1 hypothetical protein GS4_23_00160 [Gordonia soli NBRC 108243]
MSDFTVDKPAISGSAKKIASAASRINLLRMSPSFELLDGSFSGATNNMHGIASTGDQKIKTSLRNGGEHVRGWSELVSGCRDIVASVDDSTAADVRATVPLPAAVAVDPDNRR